MLLKKTHGYQIKKVFPSVEILNISESDEELVKLYQNGDEAAFNKLFLKYRERAYRFSSFVYASRVVLKGVLFEDILMASWESLVFAAKKFDISKKDVTFSGYWREIARHEIDRIYINEAKQRPKYCRHLVSLNDYICEDITLGDVVSDRSVNIIGSINAQEKLCEFNESVQSLCDETEQLIISLRMNDEPFEKIATQLRMSEKHVRYLYRRAKQKLEI